MSTGPRPPGHTPELRARAEGETSTPVALGVSGSFRLGRHGLDDLWDHAILPVLSSRVIGHVGEGCERLTPDLEHQRATATRRRAGTRAVRGGRSRRVAGVRAEIGAVVDRRVGVDSAGILLLFLLLLGKVTFDELWMRDPDDRDVDARRDSVVAWQLHLIVAVPAAGRAAPGVVGHEVDIQDLDRGGLACDVLGGRQDRDDLIISEKLARIRPLHRIDDLVAADVQGQRRAGRSRRADFHRLGASRQQENSRGRRGSAEQPGENGYMVPWSHGFPLQLPCGPAQAMDGMHSPKPFRLEIPDPLASSHVKFFGDAGRAWIAALPQLAADCMDRWALQPDGPLTHGAVALVVPVLLADRTPAVLKLQPVDEETAGEPIALRAWNGDGAVRLLRHDPDSGSMVLERLDADHSLAAVDDDLAALQTLAELLARLTAVPAPQSIRRLAGIAASMLDQVPHALALVPEPSTRRLIQRCAGAVEELLPEAGDRLLHWDLHYDNVLRRHPGSDREPWLAIDPKPLAGDRGFELLPALNNRWDDVVATGNVGRAVTMRFDLMTEVLGLDRQRAAGWTLGRVLQNMLWDVENDDATWHTDPDIVIAQVLLDRHSRQMMGSSK
jgi:streptomycin 6-kinase